MGVRVSKHCKSGALGDSKGERAMERKDEAMTSAMDG